MKLILIAIVMATTAHAADNEYYTVNGKRVESKAEALISKARDARAVVYKCSEQELSPKATLKNK